MNLDAARPVYVNGHATTERNLVDGDIITAGESRFGVYLDDGGSQIRKLGVRLAGTMPERTNDPRVSPSADTASYAYRSTDYASGLTTFSSTQDEFPIAEFARSIANEYSLYLLVDASVIGQVNNRRVAELVGVSPDVDFPSETQGLRRVLIGPNQASDRLSIMQEVWGLNAVVAVFCACETAFAIRAIAQCPLLAMTSPAQLERRLASASVEELQTTFGKVRALTTELQQGSAWSTSTFSRPAAHWENLGLPNAPAS